MDTHRIMSEIDAVESEAELQDALAIIVDDIAAQVKAVRTAVTDNPHVDSVPLARVLDMIHVEAND